MNEFDNIIDDLLIKYNYCESCPDFLKYVRAKKLIPEFLKIVQDYEQITIASFTQKDRGILKPYLRELEDRIIYIDLSFPLLENDMLRLRDSLGAKRGIVLLASFLFYCELTIELHKEGIEYVSLYEYFINQGLFFSREFYSYQPVSYSFPQAETIYYPWMQPNNEYHLFFLYRNRYELALNLTTREYYLRALIFVCVDMRDFVYASKYLEEYKVLKQEKHSEIIEFENAVFGCLSLLQSRLRDRRQKDLVLFLIDSLEYGDDKHMPFLCEQSTSGITFENAYTVTPFTNPTLRTIFCEKTVIDDQSYHIEIIGREESPIIRLLEEKGYTFTYIGCSAAFDNAYKGQEYIFWETPQTRIYWSAIGEILRSQKPVCALIHELTSTHEPFISNEIQDGYFYCTTIRALKWEQRIDLKRSSTVYTDEQLKFYSSLLPKQARRLYFGDHGTTEFGRIHPVLMMQWEGCPTYTVKRLFSYINFSKLIEKIISDSVENLQSLCTDYVAIQDVDIYMPGRIDRYIKQDDYIPQNGPSYRGVVTNDSTFIRYRTGAERYWRTVADKGIFTQEELSKLRELAGEEFLDPENNPKFQYSKRFKLLTNHYKERTGTYEERKLERIKQLFSQEFTDKKIAIRGGGFTTYQFLLWADLCSYMYCVVDIDKNALAGKLGLEVLMPQEAYERPIDLLITVDDRLHAIAQSEPWTCPLMDLVAFGKAEGILTTEHYGNYAITPEDIKASL